MNSEKPWWIASPEEVDKDDPSYLCEICRHIDFRCLVSSTSRVYEEIQLASVFSILQRQECAFCHLIKRTLEEAFASSHLQVEQDGKPVLVYMCACWNKRYRCLRAWVKAWLYSTQWDVSPLCIHMSLLILTAQMTYRKFLYKNFLYHKVLKKL
jgi:hypothetical protein